MRPLSSVYHRDLIHYVIQTKSFQCLKHVVLSSQEMSHGFGYFMRDIFVSYDRGSFCFRTPESNILVRYYVSWYFKNWLTPFIRMLWINHTTPRSEEIGFLEDVYRYKNLVALNLVKMKVDLFAVSVIKNLMPIPRWLILDFGIVGCLSTWLCRFESVLLTLEKFNPYTSKCPSKFDPFKNDIDFRESNVLELVHDIDAILCGYADLLRKIDSLVRHVRVRHIIFEDGNGYTTAKCFQEVIGKLATTYSNIKSIRIGIRSDCSSKDCAATMKTRFDRFLQDFREFNPASTKVKMVLLCNAKRVKIKGPVFTSNVFPSEDFDIAPNGRVCTNRRTKIAENLEFFFRCEF